MPKLKKPEMFKDKRNMRLSIMTLILVLVIVIGAVLLGISHASSPYAAVDPYSGTVAGVASQETDNGNYVKFDIPSTTSGSLCGFKTGTPTISKVMVIWEENESDSSIIGNSSLPYMNSLVSQCGFANNYWSYTHPSLPNYMAMTSGVSYASGNWPNDCLPSSSCETANASLFSQLGSNWKSYAESMTANCQQVNAGSTDSSGSQVYAPKHNPAVYYTNISAACNTQDVPMGTTTSGALYNDVTNGTLPELSTVSPNLSDDWHDGSASAADNWLKSWMGVISAGSDYQSGKLAVLVIFDEGNGSGNVSSNTYATWLSAFTKPGVESPTFFDDNSVTQTVEKILGLSTLNTQQLDSTGSADNNMVSAFNL